MGNDEGEQPQRPMLEARYVNAFSVGFNAFEVVVECGQAYEEQPEPLWHTRMITTPVYAKHLLELLKETLDRYEKTFGTIPRGDAA